ncbi:hypothetical protein LguiB_024499 [Lonicera macranthoides]
MMVVTNSTTPPPPSALLLHLNNRNLHTSNSITTTSLNPKQQCKYELNSSITESKGRIRRIGRTWALQNNNPTAVESQSLSSSSLNGVDSAANVVRKFYAGINGRDLSSVEGLIADNCVYEDLVFPRPFVGRKAILDFFKGFMDSISADLQFAIDEISEEDTKAVGVTWHLEWKGKPFPFSKGCSFYQLEVMNGQRQIIYGRDVVEPFIKPGEMALVAIRGVTWLLQKFPQLADRL